MNRKMSYGMKISKPGFDVLNLDKERSPNKPKEHTLPNLLSSLALPYLLGAKAQVERYMAAAISLEKKTTLGTLACLHEASTLFEDLNTIAKYVEMCGYKNDLNSLWLDIRNHIRHDVREEYDDESDTRKNKRAERLGLHPNLQTSIGFDLNGIKVGEILIEIDQINEYITWAENIITNILIKAEKDGFMRQSKS
jgi:hypothetical protein